MVGNSFVLAAFLEVTDYSGTTLFLQLGNGHPLGYRVISLEHPESLATSLGPSPGSFSKSTPPHPK